MHLAAIFFISIAMNIIVALFKRLFTSILSIFDIVSDLVNSCDFLGYDASGQIIRTIFWDESNITNPNNIPTVHPDNHTSLETASAMCGLNYTFNETMANGENNTSQYGATDGLKNLSSCFDDRKEIHMIWGSVGIGIMFLPGIMILIMAYITDTKNDIFDIRNGLILKRVRNFIAMALFPLTVILFQVYGVFSYKNEKVHGFMAIGVALEAFLESFLQLVLQMFTICYGHDITTTQIITICASFVILSKASIDLDLEMYEHQLTLCDTLMHYLKMIPGYCATIAFRAIAFSFTLAFLRGWSLIPMGVLIVELILTYRIAFGTFGQIDGSVTRSPFIPVMITNLGVTNVGMIGANEYVFLESKEDGDYVKQYINMTNIFIKLSSTASFIHHATVLSAILGLVINDRNHFIHWQSPAFILNNYDGYFYEKKFYIFAGTIGMGLIGLCSSLYLGAKGLRIAIKNK